MVLEIFVFGLIIIIKLTKTILEAIAHYRNVVILFAFFAFHLHTCPVNSTVAVPIKHGSKNIKDPFTPF